MAEPTFEAGNCTDPALTPLVRMRGITKQFPGVLALDQADLELRAGELHALAGENGSGKSTLAKILYGALVPDAGEIELDGKPVQLGTPARALEHGIVAISQELTLAPSLSVTENVLMGRLPHRHGFIDWPEARALARTSLDQLGVHVDERARVSELSIELQQEVEVARAVSANSRILILDEATSSLSEAATDRLLEKLEQLRESGVAILFISHRLRELYASAQRCTVLRDGIRVGTVELTTTNEAELVRMMVGREIRDLFGKQRIQRGEERLTVAGLTTEDGSVMDAAFEVRRGEIVGVAGLVGSGKSELALALAGGLPAQGLVRVDGKIVDLRSPRRAVRRGIGFVPEDRKRSAIFPTRSVRQNLSLAWMALLVRIGIVDVHEERRMVNRTVEQFSVRTPTIERAIVQLSGGNQQKVILGRTFALSPGVVVLAEPTRGIDVGAKSEVYQFIQRMSAEGAAVLMSSSELPELLGVADRILVMFRGRIRAEFDAQATDEETIARVAFGGAEIEDAAP